jgi:integrase
MQIGSVTELSPGRWRARGPRPERRPLGVWPTREKAEAILAAAMDELSRADRTREPGCLLRDFGARVLSERAKEFPRSAGAERTRWKRIAASPLADLPLHRLDAPEISRWLRDLGAELPGSARPTLSLLSAIVGRAIDERLLTANVCRDVKVRLPPRTEDPWTYLLPAEQRALLVAPVPEVDALQIAVLLGTGVRAGELFSLRLADVHLEDRDPWIWIRYGSPKGPPKGGKPRHVPVFGLALAAFRRWLELLPSYCPDNPRGLAFPGRRGGYQEAVSFLVRQTTVEGRKAYLDDFREALALAGITRPVRAHDLRHTWAVSCLCGWWGVPWRLEDVSAALGHHAIGVTHQYYAHLDLTRLRDLARQTPGPRLGHGFGGSRALPPANAARIALLSAAPAGTRCSSEVGEIHGVRADFGPGVPVVTREAAIEGVRALERGDLDAARLAAASGWSADELLRLFGAALDEEHARRPDIAVGHRGRR